MLHKPTYLPRIYTVPTYVDVVGGSPTPVAISLSRRHHRQQKVINSFDTNFPRA